MGIISTLKEILRLGGSPYIDMYMIQGMDLNSSSADVAHVAAACSSADGMALQEILTASSLEEKLKLTLYYLGVDLEMSKMQSKIRTHLEEKIATNQRKFYLNEQLKLIKKELGLEKDEKETLVNKFLARLEKKEVPEHARKVIDEEVQKLQALEPTSSEFNLTRNYLDWLTILPWGVFTKDRLDIPHAESKAEVSLSGLSRESSSLSLTFSAPPLPSPPLLPSFIAINYQMF